MPHLPARPWSVSASFKARTILGILLQGGAAIGIVLAIVWLGIPAVQDIRRQAELWERGIPALSSTLGGEERSSNFILNSYDLEATWRDATGTAHAAQIEFALLFKSIPSDAAYELRYDPDNPDRWALSWAVEHAVHRWMAIVGGVLVGLLLMAGLAAGIRQLRRRSALIAGIAERGIEIEVLVLEELAPPHRRGDRSVVYEHVLVAGATDPEAAPGAASDVRGDRGRSVVALGRPLDERRGVAAVPRSRELLYVDAAKSRVLALADPQSPARPLLLTRDLFPFRLTPTERNGILERLGAPGRA